VNHKLIAWFNQSSECGRAGLNSVPILDIDANGKKELRTIGKEFKSFWAAGNRHLVNPDGTTIITG
jgi:hypothetical protein